MKVTDVVRNCSTDRRCLRRYARPSWWKVRSKRFWDASVIGTSYQWLLIGKSVGRIGSHFDRHQCKEREGATLLHPCKSISITGRQRINSGTRGGKLTKIQNTLWPPIWAQALLLTTRQMALTVNHRGVPMPASTQGQPAAAPATSPQGQLIAYRLAFAFVDAQSTAHVRA